MCSEHFILFVLLSSPRARVSIGRVYGVEGGGGGEDTIGSSAKNGGALAAFEEEMAAVSDICRGTVGGWDSFLATSSLSYKKYILEDERR